MIGNTIELKIETNIYLESKTISLLAWPCRYINQDAELGLILSVNYTQNWELGTAAYTAGI